MRCRAPNLAPCPDCLEEAIKAKGAPLNGMEFEQMQRFRNGAQCLAHYRASLGLPELPIVTSLQDCFWDMESSGKARPR